MNQSNSVTLAEINNQPRLWKKICESKPVVGPEFFADPQVEYIVSGAGSSSFVGETVAGVWQQKLPGTVRVAATTDIVTHPRLFFRPGRKQVLISYSRSGDSPESVASVNIASQINPEIRHLVLTCNPEGALGRLKKPGMLIQMLPDEANDRGLAMTGSVSGMILSSLVLSGMIQSTAFISAAEKFLREQGSSLQEIAQLPIERVAILGSGPLLGAARESHLKIQELCDGQVICKHDSFLGFRHGPKAIINDKTLLIYLTSPLAPVREYEMDLVRAIAKEKSALHTLAVCDSNLDLPVDTKIAFDFDGPSFNEADRILPYLLPAQLLGVFKSIHLGLNPDSPSERGAIHRVVQGVTIYPYRDA